MNNCCLSIIVYKRSQNLRAILDVAVNSDLRKIQIYLDAPKTDIDRDQVEDCRFIADEYVRRFPNLVELYARVENLGSAGNVLAALDEMFDKYTYGIILEDDCIPSSDFFNFCQDAFGFLDSTEDAVMACGSKYFADTPSEARLSIYPLIWGWCTTAEKWSILRKAYSRKSLASSKNPTVSKNETIFWKNGRWRAVNGYIDAWDIPLVDLMLAKNLVALHAPVNLISNTGDDQYALHTESESQFCNLSTGKYLSLGSPRYNPHYDLMLRKELYRIKSWHFLTGFVHNMSLFLFRKRTGLLARNI